MDQIKSAVLAAGVAWMVHGFTDSYEIKGQVLALGQSVARIEQRVDQLARAQGLPTAVASK